MKKRGFGAGKWNGAGGKQNKNELIEETAKREVTEELGVTIENLEEAGQLDFYFPDKPEWNQKAYVYLSRDWRGEPMETEEMRPQWFEINNLPVEEMWEADRVWLPKILAGEKVEGEIFFSDEGKVLKMSYY